VIDLQRERDEWKAKYIQQNKDLGCEQMDPNGTIWDHAKTLQRERDEAREESIRWQSIAEGRGRTDDDEQLAIVTAQRDGMEEKLRIELRGYHDSKLWGEAGLIAATMRCVDALDVVTAQRDRLAAVLQKIRDGYGGQVASPNCCADCDYLLPIDEALQFLTLKP
jgi:hypothetical protein